MCNCVCRHSGGCSHGNHSHNTVLNRDVCDPQEAMEHGVPKTFRAVLYHWSDGARRRRTRGSAARRDARACLLRQGPYTLLAAMMLSPHAAREN